MEAEKIDGAIYYSSPLPSPWIWIALPSIRSRIDRPDIGFWCIPCFT